MEAITIPWDESQAKTDQVFNQAYEFAKSANSIPTMSEYLEYKRFVESYSTGASVHDLRISLGTIPNFIDLAKANPFKRQLYAQAIEQLKSQCYQLIKHNLDSNLKKIA